MIEDEYKLDRCSPLCKMIVSALDTKFGSVKVNSGSRTQAENTSAGRASDSMHLQGRAVDVSVRNVHVIKIANFLLENILKYPWTRMAINLSENFVHFDDKESVEVPTVRFYYKGAWAK